MNSKRIWLLKFKRSAKKVQSTLPRSAKRHTAKISKKVQSKLQKEMYIILILNRSFIKNNCAYKMNFVASPLAYLFLLTSIAKSYSIKNFVLYNKSKILTSKSQQSKRSYDPVSSSKKIT